MKFILFLIFSISLFSQEKNITSSTNDNKILLYNIKLFFPYSVIHQYRMDEETDVVREYEDGTKYTYKKRITWYISSYAPKISTREGEKELYVSIDSINYEFSDGNFDIKFDNSGQYIPPGHVWDFEKTFLLNSKEFNMFYDAYNNAYDISSERILQELNFVEDYSGKNADFKKEQVKRRFDTQEIIFTADPVKGMLPSNSVALDSSWNVNLKFDVDFVTFNNICSATLSKVKDSHYYINLKADTLYCIDEDMLLDDIKKVGKINAGLANGNIELSISTRGHVKYLTSKFEAIINGKVDNVKYIERKKSFVNWNLVGMWNQ